MKKVLIVNDLNSCCNCSLNVMIPISSELGITPCPLPTGIYSNSKCFGDVSFIDCTIEMENFINAWKVNNIKYDGIMTGFMLSEKQIDIIENYIKYNNFSDVLIDPVMGDDGILFGCFSNDYVNRMREFINNSEIITPNLTELCLLTDVDYHEISSYDIDKMLIIIEKLSKKLNKVVITTGIPLNDKIITVIYDGLLKSVCALKYGNRVIGTGDIFSSIVFSEYLNGKKLYDAVSVAVSYISNLIKENINNNDYDPNYGLSLRKIKK